mgnify:CR=1 FL=1
MSAEVTEFEEIFAEAREKLAITYDQPDLIPYGIRLVALCQSHPQLREEFARTFIRMFFDEARNEVSLIEFAMHALRWPEVKLAFEALSQYAVSKNDWRIINPIGHILDAFEDGWENAQDFYGNYFKQRT